MSSVTLAGSVESAIRQLEVEYADVDWEPDGEGGAYVSARPVDFGARWTPDAAPLQCQLAFNYPDAAIYPFYTTFALQSTIGLSPPALQRVSWRGAEVIQISLRPRVWRPEHDTASTALALVGHWFRTVQ